MINSDYDPSLCGCGDCSCTTCLLYQSQRCTHGECWDDWRAKNEPWPGRERRAWTNWALPGEQAHWCRGGIFYGQRKCPDWIEYQREKTVVRVCFGECITQFQDGYIMCGLINLQGCEKCMEMYGPKEE